MIIRTGLHDKQREVTLCTPSRKGLMPRWRKGGSSDFRLALVVVTHLGPHIFLDGLPSETEQKTVCVLWHRPHWKQPLFPELPVASAKASRPSRQASRSLNPNLLLPCPSLLSWLPTLCTPNSTLAALLKNRNCHTLRCFLSLRWYNS